MPVISITNIKGMALSDEKSAGFLKIIKKHLLSPDKIL